MKKTGKILALLMAAVMLLATAGCSSDGDQTADGKFGSRHQARTISRSASSTFPIRPRVLAIPILMMWESRKCNKLWGLETIRSFVKNNIADDDVTATDRAIRECIEEGCNIIFGTSFNYMDTMEALAQEFPNIIFSHGTGYKSNDTNLNNYFGRIYQARYLSGIAAGLKTESNLIGYVAAMGKENSEVTGGIDAFAMGVYSVNPDAQVYVKVTNSWFDPEGETAAAQALLGGGMRCDRAALRHPQPPDSGGKGWKMGRRL